MLLGNGSDRGWCPVEHGWNSVRTSVRLSKRPLPLAGSGYLEVLTCLLKPRGQYWLLFMDVWTLPWYFGQFSWSVKKLSSDLKDASSRLSVMALPSDLECRVPVSKSIMGFFFAHLLAPHCTGCFAHALHCSHVLTLLHSFAHTRTRTNALPLFWKLIEFRPFWVALLRYHRWLVRSFFLTKYDIKSTHFISAQKPSLVTPNIRCVPPSSKPLITTNSSIWALYNSLGAYCVLLCVRLQKFWWTEHVTRNGGLIYNAPP